MTTSTLPQTRNRKRTRFLGLAAITVVLGSTLTACGGSEFDNTTCGEIKEMSGQEFFDFIKDAADDEGTDEAKQAAETFEAVPEDQRDATKDLVVEGICSGESDDTKLKDTELGEG